MKKKIVYNKKFFNQIVKICGQNNVLVVPIIFIEFFNDIGTAIIVSQLLYWCDKSKTGDGYIYKAEADWYRETGLSRHRVMKSVRKLEAMEIIDMKKKMANGSPTWHFKLNIHNFLNMVIKFLGLEPEKVQDATLKNEVSITEPISELKTEQVPELNKKIKEEKNNNNEEFSLKGRTLLNSLGIKPSFE